MNTKQKNRASVQSTKDNKFIRLKYVKVVMCHRFILLFGLWEIIYHHGCLKSSQSTQRKTFFYFILPMAYLWFLYRTFKPPKYEAYIATIRVSLGHTIKGKNHHRTVKNPSSAFFGIGKSSVQILNLYLFLGVTNNNITIFLLVVSINRLCSSIYDQVAKCSHMPYPNKKCIQH